MVGNKADQPLKKGERGSAPVPVRTAVCAADWKEQEQSAYISSIGEGGPEKAAL